MHKLATVLLTLAFALPAAAAENRFDPQARAKAIAPFLDAETIALAHIDVTRVDVEGLAGALTKFAHLTAEEVIPFKQTAQQWIADFKKAGGKEVYLVASLNDLPWHLSLVFPIQGEANTRALLELLGSKKSSVSLRFGIETIEKVDRAIFAGSKPALARFRAGKPAPRPEVAKAFAAVGDTVAQLLLLPTADVRRVVEEVIPTLPKEVGNGPSTIFTRGVQWTAIGLDGLPKLSLRLVIQSQDAASAQSLGASLANVYGVLGRDKEIQRFLPNVNKMLVLLTPQVTGDRLKLTFHTSDPATAGLLNALGGLATQRARRAQCVNNLKQILLALHNYHSVRAKFPAQANYDSQGKPLLSWRVLVLPFLAEEKLYKEFHLDEPWDSEHNKKLIARMPAVYRCPNMQRSLKNKTTYLGPVNESAMFTGGPAGVPIKDVPDGTSKTIFIVDAADDHAVIWTKPEDLKYDPKNPREGLIGHHDNGILAAFADGSVHFLPSTIDNKTLLALFTRNGGEVVSVP